MTEYEFTLTFALPNPEADPEQYVDALFKAGCDDAGIGTGLRGYIALDFIREAESAAEAMLSALQNVKEAIPGAELTEASPDLVNLTAIGEAVGCTRQNMRKYFMGEATKVKSPFPAPVVTGSSPMWHLYNVAKWMAENSKHHAPRPVMEVAMVAQSINLAKEVFIAPQEEKGLMRKAMELLQA